MHFQRWHLLPFGIFLLLSCSLSTAAPLPTAAPTPEPQVTVLIATPTPLSQTDLAPIDIEEELITNLYERVGPSVVHIKATVVTMNFFFGPTPSEGTGSGFIYDNQGHIVTNYHVIEDARTVEVELSDETRLTAEVVGIDPPNDLAVLRVTEPIPEANPLPMGTSADLRVGQRAIAIGNPFGLDRTLTTGVISALGRPLQLNQDEYIFDVIQTDAAINPGNSGGPLLNSRGEVIGVNTAVRQDAQGIGFAIPADTVQRVVPKLITDGRYPHPWLGLLGYSLTPELAEALRLPVERGVLVAQLYRNGPAVEAGIQGATQEVLIGNRRVLIGGDIITAVNGESIQNWNDIQEFLQLYTEAGQTITLSLVRGEQQLELPLTLGIQP